MKKRTIPVGRQKVLTIPLAETNKKLRFIKGKLLKEDFSELATLKVNCIGMALHDLPVRRRLLFDSYLTLGFNESSSPASVVALQAQMLIWFKPSLPSKFFNGSAAKSKNELRLSLCLKPIPVVLYAVVEQQGTFGSRIAGWSDSVDGSAEVPAPKGRYSISITGVRPLTGSVKLEAESRPELIIKQLKDLQFQLVHDTNEGVVKINEHVSLVCPHNHKEQSSFIGTADSIADSKIAIKVTAPAYGERIFFADFALSDYQWCVYDFNPKDFAITATAQLIAPSKTGTKKLRTMSLAGPVYTETDLPEVPNLTITSCAFSHWRKAVVDKFMAHFCRTKNYSSVVFGSGVPETRLVVTIAFQEKVTKQDLFHDVSTWSVMDDIIDGTPYLLNQES